ncbi:MAG TPA: tetratricopeptide repeat protein [Candidatus Aminicenantes bacterium]|nr:tetratricopeptide repeat protein [Candidatus Aminicenantes bacterium]
MNYKKLFTFIIAAMLIFSLSAWAQQGRGRGRIHGTVKDEAGNPIEGAKIVAQHLEFNTTFESKSDEKGNWAIAGLGTGFFRITATKEGYAPVYHEMRVSQFSRNNPPVHFTLKKVQARTLGAPAIDDEASLAIFEEGNNLFDQGNYQEAVTKFEAFLSKNPTLYHVYINLGNCYREMGDYEKALQYYQSVLDKIKEGGGEFAGNEVAARALANIGHVYIKQGDFAKGQEYLKQAIDIFPQDETLAFNVAEIYFKERQIDEAIKYYQLAIQIKPDWAPPYRQIGYAYLNKADYQNAVDNLKKFVELAPDDPQTPTIRNLIPKLEELIKK